MLTTISTPIPNQSMINTKSITIIRVVGGCGCNRLCKISKVQQKNGSSNIGLHLVDELDSNGRHMPRQNKSIKYAFSKRSSSLFAGSGGFSHVSNAFGHFHCVPETTCMISYGQTPLNYHLFQNELVIKNDITIIL